MESAEWPEKGPVPAKIQPPRGHPPSPPQPHLCEVFEQAKDPLPASLRQVGPGCNDRR